MRPKTLEIGIGRHCRLEQGARRYASGIFAKLLLEHVACCPAAERFAHGSVVTRVLARRETYEDVMRADVWPLERAVRG